MRQIKNFKNNPAQLTINSTSSGQMGKEDIKALTLSVPDSIVLPDIIASFTRVPLEQLTSVSGGELTANLEQEFTGVSGEELNGVPRE